MGKKVFLCSSSRHCENNIYLGTQVYNYLKENNIYISKKVDEADVIIINTCAFNKYREDDAINIIDYFYNKYNNKKDIIICGCLSKINPKYNNYPGVYPIGPKELNKFNQYFNIKNIKIEGVKANKLNKGFCSEEYGFPEHYYIQICQGCINNCSYCAIKKAKENVTSKTIDEIINELKIGLKLGYDRFVLLADDCGSYGHDIGIDFAFLLNRLNELDEDFKLNIHYIHPTRLLDLYPKINKDIFKNKIYFMNIPIQSTSQKILKLMNRNYDIKKLLNIIKEIKSISNEICLDTHIIYGFPSETRKEFVDTLHLTEYFNRVLYFQYTEKKCTHAIIYSKKNLSDMEILYRTLFIRSLISSKILLTDNINQSFKLLDKIKKLDILFINFISYKNDEYLPSLSLINNIFKKNFNILILNEQYDKDINEVSKIFIKKFNLLGVVILFDNENKTEKVFNFINYINKNNEITIIILDEKNILGNKFYNNTNKKLIVLNKDGFKNYFTSKKNNTTTKV